MHSLLSILQYFPSFVLKNVCIFLEIYLHITMNIITCSTLVYSNTNLNTILYRNLAFIYLHLFCLLYIVFVTYYIFNYWGPNVIIALCSFPLHHTRKERAISSVLSYTFPFLLFYRSGLITIYILYLSKIVLISPSF